MKTNMYRLSVKQWSPFVGCEHACVYCASSFQAQLKRWAKKHCSRCYSFVPHEHPERLFEILPRTGYMQFIFVCSNGDIAFCSTGFLEEIMAVIAKKHTLRFLIQSKNPYTFNRISISSNVILGVTIETNRDDLYEGISMAPKPSDRFNAFLGVKHSLKMVTVEPVIDFDVDVMVEWIKQINPCMVWLGYDSKSNYLPEPELQKVKVLQWKLAKEGFVVMLKTIRKAWWENGDEV